MNLATLVSTCACVVGLLFAALAVFLSSAPGMRGLREFAFTCIASGLYALTNAAMASSSPAVARLGVQFSVFFVGLLTVAWYTYTAAREERPLSSLERALVIGAVVAGVADLVPGALFTDEVWVHGVPALGIRYIDAPLTPLGSLALAYCLSCGALLAGRGWRRFRNAEPEDRAAAIGLTLLMAAGFNDALVGSGVVAGPYLLDLGFLSLLVCVGSALAWRFVGNARALQTAQQDLIERERLAAVGEMSAAIAHEVRSPIAVLFNAATLLRTQPGERDKLLSIVEEEATRLRRLVDDFLDFARPMDAHPQATELEPLLRGVAEGVRVASGEDVELTLDPALAAAVVDARLLRHALMNLVTNAVQAERRRGPVRVEARPLAEGWVRFAVVDDGAGVPPELAERIFQPFVTTRSTGTGLGLPIVQRIARAHGGKATVTETPGGGATFRLDLPVGAASSP